jgi:taurine dioxygenase
MGTLEIRALSPVVGVEVGGVDLTEPLTDHQQAELLEAFREHRLVLFRGQEISDDDHVRLCSYLLPVNEGVGYVSNTEVKGFHPGDFNLLYHSDFMFLEHPLLGISLYAIEVAPDAAGTRFVNTEVAAREMPAEMRAKFGELDVVLLANTVDGREDIPARTVRVPDDAPWDRYMRTTRPVISDHPITHTPFIPVSGQQASHFVGRTEAESDALLDEIFAYLYDDRFVYEHHWVKDDLIIWDNVTLQHGRRENAPEARRCLRRITMNDVSMQELLAGTVWGGAVTAT